jgi:hypothetical protein
VALSCCTGPGGRSGCGTHLLHWTWGQKWVWHSPAALDLGAGVGVALTCCTGSGGRNGCGTHLLHWTWGQEWVWHSPAALDLGAGVGVADVSRETPRERTRGRGEGLGLGVGFGGLKYESYFILVIFK